MSDSKSRCPFCGAVVTKPPAISAALRCGSCLRLFAAEPPSPSQPISERASENKSSTNDSTSATRDYARTLDLLEQALELPSEAQHRLNDISRPTVALPSAPAASWRRVLKSASLAAAALLLSLTLAGQILWAQRERFQHQPQLNPLFTAACELLECSVPAFVDISALRGEALSVASEAAGSLTVSFRLRNEAPLPQAPPILILSFTTPSQRSVALREFAPADYLPTGRDPQRPLGAGEGVAINLALVDPGADAVNYTLGFRAP